MFKNIRGQSEVISVVIITGTIIAIAIVAMYFGGSMLTSSSSVGEFLAAQSNMITLAELLECKGSTPGAAGSTTFSTALGQLAVEPAYEVTFYITNPPPFLNVESLNGTITSVIKYYAHSGVSGRLLNGSTISPNTIAYLKDSNSPVSVYVAYDTSAGRWCVCLETRPYALATSSNHTIVYMTILRPTSSLGERVSSMQRSIVKFYIEDQIYRDDLPEGSTVTITINGETFGPYGGPNETITLIVTVARISIAPGG